MNKPLTEKALAGALLVRFQSTTPLQGLDSHVVPSDREAIDTTIGEDCTLRIRAQVSGPAERRTYSATLAVAYQSTDADYDQLWSVESRDPSERYFPLASGLSDLTDAPAAGYSASDPNAVDLLAQEIMEAICERAWPIRTRECARVELERGHHSPWYSLLAFQNWLPVALLLEEGSQRAYAFAQGVLAEQTAGESARAISYRRFVANLKRRGAN